MKAIDVVTPNDVLDERCSPRASETRIEFAVEAGGMVLNSKRYNTPEDAYFYGCLIANARDRERCGRIMIRRRVTFGTWEPVEGGAE